MIFKNVKNNFTFITVHRTQKKFPELNVATMLIKKITSNLVLKIKSELAFFSVSQGQLRFFL